MKKNIQSIVFYNFFSFLYDKLITWNGYKKALAHFMQRIPLRGKRLKVLDAGCGTGLVSFALAEKYPNIEIIGFDYSKNMIEVAEKINIKRKFKNIKFYVGDLENINPLRDLKNNKQTLAVNSFDLIFVAGALEYTDLSKGIDELAKFLKNKGTLYNIAVKDNWKGKLLGYLMGFTPYPKIKIMKSFQVNGFKRVEEIPFIGKVEQKASHLKIVLKAIR